MRRHSFLPVVLVAALGRVLSAADTPATPAATPSPKITPGKVINPGLGFMRRIFGELISVDLATRTGKFRPDNGDEVLSFTVLPYAELLHHASHGDLDDFRIGERAIFKLHQNDAGEWVWLGYIQDEMNMMKNHGEYYFVDSIDVAKGQIQCSQASADKKYVRETDIYIETRPDTRFWKGGELAKFTDLKVGDTFRAKTHHPSKDKHRIAWEIFLDDESLLKFKAEQDAVFSQRIQREGAPGYVDASNGTQLDLTIFADGSEITKDLKPGDAVSVAPAGVDRNPTAKAVPATVAGNKMVARDIKLSLTLSAPPTAPFPVTGLARVWK